MPIYEYQHSTDRYCEHCARAFEVLQKATQPPLQLCPRCHNPVRRKVSAVNLASPAPSLDDANLDKHGFTKFRKVEKGVYEKTAGPGPKIISDKE